MYIKLMDDVICTTYMVSKVSIFIKKLGETEAFVTGSLVLPQHWFFCESCTLVGFNGVNNLKWSWAIDVIASKCFPPSLPPLFPPISPQNRNSWLMLKIQFSSHHASIKLWVFSFKFLDSYVHNWSVNRTFFSVWFQCIYIIDLCLKKCLTAFAGLEL